MTTYAYSMADSCRPVKSESDLLAGMLRFLRDNRWADRIVLLGHSLGGVIGVQALVDNGDLAPFVSSVVAVDTPFGAVNRALTFLVERFAECSTNWARGGGQAQRWQDYYAAVLPAVFERGTRMLAVVNSGDDCDELRALQAPSATTAEFAPGSPSVHGAVDPTQRPEAVRTP